MNKGVILLSGILIVGGGLVYVLNRNRSTLINLATVHNNRMNRTGDELIQLAYAVKDLYMRRGIVLNKEALTDALQEFLDDEDAMPLPDVFRLIDARLIGMESGN